MSGVVSGITKVFSSIGKTAASLGSAVRAVGASVFTAASGGGGGVPGLLRSGSTLGNMLSGAANILGWGGIGGAAQAATGFAGLGAGAASTLGPLAAAGTATGTSPTFGLGSFLGSESGAGLIAGLGEGLGMYYQTKAVAEERQKDRDYLRAQERRQQQNYSVPMSALAGGTQTAVASGMSPMEQRPTPAQAYSMPATKPRPRQVWKYDRESGEIVSVQM